jgi:hypothetical protein
MRFAPHGRATRFRLRLRRVPATAKRVAGRGRRAPLNATEEYFGWRAPASVATVVLSMLAFVTQQAIAYAARDLAPMQTRLHAELQGTAIHPVLNGETGRADGETRTRHR